MSDTSKTHCRHPAGTFAPAMDPLRCVRGKEKYADVCPYGVFKIRKLAGPERSALPVLTRLKVAAHGGRQSFATLASECRACGNSVNACPQGAITLAKTN
jgi:4Fe-4S ferredoxin